MANNATKTGARSEFMIGVESTRRVPASEDIIEELRELFYDEDAVDADEDRIHVHWDGIDEDGSAALREWATQHLGFSGDPHQSVTLRL